MIFLNYFWCTSNIMKKNSKMSLGVERSMSCSGFWWKRSAVSYILTLFSQESNKYFGEGIQLAEDATWAAAENMSKGSWKVIWRPLNGGRGSSNGSSVPTEGHCWKAGDLKESWVQVLICSHWRENGSPGGSLGLGSGGGNGAWRWENFIGYRRWRAHLVFHY